MARMTKSFDYEAIRDAAYSCIDKNLVIYEVFDRATGEDYRHITKTSLKTTRFIEGMTGDVFNTESIDEYVTEALEYRIFYQGGLPDDELVSVFDIRQYRYYVKFCFELIGNKQYLHIQIHEHGSL